MWCTRDIEPINSLSREALAKWGPGLSLESAVIEQRSLGEAQVF
jgi:hypothetical protein